MMDVLMPKPKNNNPVQPATPIIVINILFLYLKIFLIVTFCKKLSLFQIGFIFSSNILFPDLGGLPLIKVLAFSLRLLLVTKAAITAVVKNPIIIAIMLYFTLNFIL